ncbi:PD40 domain-containing protein [Paenibacillus mendelii]|uniref:PD40 domain-containing protein n=1 Tax=Paenibacillus mendelii TaxID=206163 RepID=A0ABV6JIW8_9BACL|nr:PD40 domain-containing protein [Paenibacillus mendelii]MCQ6558787.1 PD40 domain-containing protein [Paenibacillus mendelii]
MKLARGNWAVAAAGIVCILMLSGCSSNTAEEERTVIVKPEKTITVVEKKPPAVSTTIEVEKIETFEGVRGMDWLSEDRLIISKSNEQVQALSVEGEKRQPNNLYIRDFGAGTDEALSEDRMDQDYAVLSPDKKHLYYKQHVEEMATGYIMNLATRETVKTGEQFVGIYESEWADNERVVFTTETGDIARSDINGNTEILLKADHSTYNTKQRGTLLYYIGQQNKLFRYDLKTKEQKALDKQVIWFVPSNDGMQFAVVKHLNNLDVEEMQMELSITDQAMQPKIKVASGNQVFGTSWSPDGTKLAYTLTSAGNVQGVYVADVVSGKATQLSVDMEQASDTLRWSPSGKKLLMSTSAFRGNKVVFISYVITLK